MYELYKNSEKRKIKFLYWFSNKFIKIAEKILNNQENYNQNEIFMSYLISNLYYIFRARDTMYGNDRQYNKAIVDKSQELNLMRVWKSSKERRLLQLDQYGRLIY